MERDSDTIAAIATAPGEGAIAVVRVSGTESLSLADRIFTCAGAPPSQRSANTFVHGYVHSADGIADEVILLIYRRPQSYTRENMIEIQGHGGSVAARRILRAVLEAGARPAEPGEFTQRAFLNGRIDLLQAEAVMDLIRAKSDRSAVAAIEQLRGRLSYSFSSLYDDILGVASDLEATLDFQEDELDPAILLPLTSRLRRCENDLKALLATWNEGHILREGALIVISGRPNVGKSTLLNALLGIDRAIVTHIPGTTRDIIEESLVIDGYLVRIIDTAGLRDTECSIEEEGIRRAKMAMQKADVILYMVDGSRELDAEERRQVNSLPPTALVIANKMDLRTSETMEPYTTDRSVIFISLLSGCGLDRIKRAIVDRLRANPSAQPHAVISERHRRIILSATKEIVEANILLKNDFHDIALVASRLRSALEILGEATGRVYHDELLKSIFSRFCIGK